MFGADALFNAVLKNHPLKLRAEYWKEMRYSARCRKIIHQSGILGSAAICRKQISPKDNLSLRLCLFLSGRKIYNVS
jgi:hypothetical protein